jgi:hypothetical protein
MAETSAPKTAKAISTGRKTSRTLRSAAVKPTAAAKKAAPKAAGAKAKPPAARAKQSKKERLASELRVEVQALRASLDEMVEQLRIKLGGQLAQLEGVVEGTAVAGSKPVKPDLKAAATMLKEIRSLKIKPKKGRTKDLVRLADLVEDLLDLLPPQP